MAKEQSSQYRDPKLPISGSSDGEQNDAKE
jgi:hypothetical protein